MGPFTGVKRGMIDLVETKVDTGRFERATGKKPKNVRGAWMFTTKEMGDPSDADTFIAKSGTLADASKAAKEWGKKKGADTVYVMESMDLDKDDDDDIEDDDGAYTREADKDVVDAHKSKTRVFAPKDEPVEYEDEDDSLKEGRADAMIKSLKAEIFQISKKLMSVSTDIGWSTEQKKAIVEAEKAVDKARSILHKIDR